MNFLANPILCVPNMPLTNLFVKTVRLLVA